MPLLQLKEHDRLPEMEEGFGGGGGLRNGGCYKQIILVSLQFWLRRSKSGDDRPSCTFHQAGAYEFVCLEENTLHTEIKERKEFIRN